MKSTINFLKRYFVVLLVLMGTHSSWAEGEAKPCLDSYSKYTRTDGTVYTGKTDKGVTCQLISTYYEVFGPSIQVMISVPGERMTQTYGTNYQYQNVKCEVAPSKIYLDVTKKDDEEYSTKQRATLKLTLLDSMPGYRVEITRPGFLKTKKSNCNISL